MCKQESSAQTPIIIFIIIIIERRSRAAVTVRLMKAEAQTGGPHQFPRRFLAEKLLKCIYGNICNAGIEKQTFSYVAFMATVMLCEGHEASQFIFF